MPVRLKMKTGLSGPKYSLAPNDEHEFSDYEAKRLIEAGFAERVETEKQRAERLKAEANAANDAAKANAEAQEKAEEEALRRERKQRPRPKQMPRQAQAMHRPTPAMRPMPPVMRLPGLPMRNSRPSPTSPLPGRRTRVLTARIRRRAGRSSS